MVDATAGVGGDAFEMKFINDAALGRVVGTVVMAPIKTITFADETSWTGVMFIVFLTSERPVMMTNIDITCIRVKEDFLGAEMITRSVRAIDLVSISATRFETFN